MASMLKIALSLFIATRSFAQQTVTVPQVEPVTSNYSPTYQFKYHVHDLMTMDYKTHEEFGENGSVRGTYTVREPNGNLRVVTYTAGDSGGFQAMVQVKPTALTEQDPVEVEQVPIQPPVTATNNSDAPLKILLDSGRRVYQTYQHEQRQRNPMKQSKTTALPVSLYQDKIILHATTQQGLQHAGHNTTQDTRNLKANTHYNAFKSINTMLAPNSKIFNNTLTNLASDKKEKGKFNNKSNYSQVPIVTATQNLETVHLPHHVRLTEMLKGGKSLSKLSLIKKELCSTEIH